MKIIPSKKYIITIIVIVALFFIYFKYIHSPMIYKIEDRYKNFNTTDIPDGLESLSAEECGKCHIAIYNEWKTSYHAKAYVDPYYQAYLKKDNYHWTCDYCHTPLLRQIKFKIVGFIDDDLNRPILDVNEDFDEKLRGEGVTCAGCHVFGGVVFGPFEANVDAPHETEYDPKFKTIEICVRCHEVPSSNFMFYQSNPCGSVEEFNNSPYKGKNTICQTCHMPQKMRPLAAGSKIFRKTGIHTFKGGHSEEMLKQALLVNLEKKGKEFRLSVLNNGAGHMFPTGDPDRFVNIITRFYDTENTLIREESETFKRTILYKPIIIEFSDNRLGPLKERSFTYTGSDIIKRAKTATVGIEYHILSDRAKEKLVKRYGLPEDTPSVITPKPFMFTF